VDQYRLLKNAVSKLVEKVSSIITLSVQHAYILITIGH
jgi:hypothetical protein